LPNLCKKVLRAQFQHRAYLSIGHQRADAIAFAIELPRNNRCAGLTALALFSTDAFFASLAAAAMPALPAENRPTVARAVARIVTPSDEGSTIERNVAFARSPAQYDATKSYGARATIIHPQLTLRWRRLFLGNFEYFARLIASTK
jgi:hypothetical protein